jgi:glyoxylase-like metal-dependent hydrolase (beta-lactamase superfamily II)
MATEPTGAEPLPALRCPPVRRWQVGAVEVTRVADPDFALVLPSEPATAAAVEERTWLGPHWVQPDGSLVVGSSAILVRTPSANVVVDPWLAFDDPAKLAPRLAALRGAGVDPADVDLVINSHIDGVGANAHTDGSPAFPNARYLIPAAEVEDLREGVHGELGRATDGQHPLVGLLEHGVVEPVVGGEQPLPGLHLEEAPGHNRGNVVVWIDSGGEQAVVVGHTFLHPAQIADPDSDRGDRDPVVLAATRRALLERCAETGALLVGPLFADPGAGLVRDTPLGWELVAAL